MKAAIPISYIVALVLGVAVIGLLGYFFVFQSGKTTETGNKAECDAKVASYCLQWKNLGGKDGKPTWSPDPKCGNQGQPNEDVCKSVGISIP